MLAYHPEVFFMSFDNFRRAVDSLADFPGIVGIFGGNPCLHPEFQRFADWMEKARPDKAKRGIWTNDYHHHRDLARRVFGYHNYNPHRGSPSWHCPAMVAIRDVIRDPDLLWNLVDRCPVQNRWSAAITQIGGKLRAYFCEVAAAWDHVYSEDRGAPVFPGWWKWDLAFFQDQITHWCPRCGMALPFPARRDWDQADDMSPTHEHLARPGRPVHVTDGTDYDLDANLDGWADDPLDYKLLRTKADERNLNR